MWDCWLPYFGIVKFMYTGFGIILYAVMLPRFFSTAKILPNPKLEKEKEKKIHKV